MTGFTVQNIYSTFLINNTCTCITNTNYQTNYKDIKPFTPNGQLTYTLFFEIMKITIPYKALTKWSTTFKTFVGHFFCKTPSYKDSHTHGIQLFPFGQLFRKIMTPRAPFQTH